MRRLALLLCAFALALPACGEDDDTGSQAQPTATPTEEKGDRGGYGY